MNYPTNYRSVTRIGVFYDGNYFLHVSNYYNYFHFRRRRLSISGIHDFIREQVALEENSDKRLCHVVDSHYFRGRLNAQEASQRGNMLYYDRVFDDVLMSEGVVTHYLPLKIRNGKVEEKGIDVWLALEAYELALIKKYDVLVLIASDGDYVPLVRKLNTLGTRVMVLSWDFAYEDDGGREVITRTSQDLLEEVTYPIAMHEIIDNRVKRNDSLINNLFVLNESKKSSNSETDELIEDEEGPQVSYICSLKNGYGFVEYAPNNLFFHASDVVDNAFEDLQQNDLVEFVVMKNEKNQLVAKQLRKVSDTEEFQ